MTYGLFYLPPSCFEVDHPFTIYNDDMRNGEVLKVQPLVAQVERLGLLSALKHNANVVGFVDLFMHTHSTARRRAAMAWVRLAHTQLHVTTAYGAPTKLTLMGFTPKAEVEQRRPGVDSTYGYTPFNAPKRTFVTDIDYDTLLRVYLGHGHEGTANNPLDSTGIKRKMKLSE